MYAKGQLVEAHVENVYPFGVFVRLKDGTRAYIRRRELTAAGDLDPHGSLREGDSLVAAVWQLPSSDRILELSVRATLPDPWQDIALRCGPGSVATGTVRRLAADRVYVQVAPGLDGVIPLSELAPWPVGRPEDLLWVGDHVEGLVIQLEPAAHRLRISLRRRMEQLVRVDAVAQRLYEQAASPGGAVPVAAEAPPPEAEHAAEVVLPGAVFVVEDHADLRLPLMRWLSDQGCAVQGAGTGREALDAWQPAGYALLLVDLDLPELDGLGFIRSAREAGYAGPVAVMSAPESIAARIVALQALDVSTAFAKPLDMEEIQAFLAQLARGERPALGTAHTPETPPEIQAVQGLTNLMRSGRPLAERWGQALQQFVQETHAEAGAVFRLDRAAWSVTLAAAAGRLTPNHDALYGLVESPVKDVIVEGRHVWETHASAERTGKYRKLLDLLPFESCIGMPVQAGGGIEYALFVFHREPDAFSRYRLRDATAFAALLGVGLESQTLDERIQSLGRILLSGQLAAAFGHEVYNKLSGLDFQFSNLRTDVGRVAQAEPSAAPVQYQDALHALDTAMENAAELRRIVKNFRRLVEIREEQASVDLNEVLNQTEAQVRTLARHAQVAVRLAPAQELPRIAGSSLGLCQVLLNLALNALQHMEQSPGSRRLLTLSSEASEGCVRVRVSDTGPGIHRQLWDQVFALGYTTRPGGSGLGLYIARSLVETMGGRLSVEESHIPMGTTFLVELPVPAANGAEE